jgi:glycopeptide antibiotics resistance protein
MNKKSGIFVLCGFILFFISAALPLFGSSYLAVIPAAAACAFFIAAGALSGDTRKSRFLFIISFYIYTIFLLAFIVFGRKLGLISFSGADYEWIKSHIFIKPFNNIRYYSSHLFTSEWKTSFTNLFGNLLALAPMGFYLPRIFPKTTRRGRFFAVLFCIVSFIELSQLIFKCGYFDIDDYILNMSGAWIVYEAFRNEHTKKRVNKALGLDV